MYSNDPSIVSSVLNLLLKSAHTSGEQHDQLRGGVITVIRSHRDCRSHAYGGLSGDPDAAVGPKSGAGCRNTRLVLDRPALFLLIGFSGTGKLSVAKTLRDRLVARGEQVRLVDNHYINNPIFQLIDVDGVRALPSGTWDRVGEVRDVVVRTIETLSPKNWSFIFTRQTLALPLDGSRAVRDPICGTRSRELASRPQIGS